MRPIINGSIGQAYGIRGSHWTACGYHTGVDYPAPLGATIYAPIAGTIRHRSYGSAFGSHQFAISPDPGKPFGEGEVFFAHAQSRLPDGTKVRAGDPIGKVGQEGNAFGPHVHMEWHKGKGSWSCSVLGDPMKVLHWRPGRVRQAWLRARGRGGLIV